MSGTGQEYEVEAIVGSKIHLKKLMYRVRWKGFGAKNDTWEPEENLAHCTILIKTFNDSQKSKRSRTPTRGATPRKSSPARTKAPPKSPSRTKTPERPKKVENAEPAKPTKMVEPVKETESDDRPKQVVAPLLTEVTGSFESIEKKITEITDNGMIITQRTSLHGLRSPVTMRKENGRYPTVSEMRVLAERRSKAKLGIEEDNLEWSDAEDENDGPYPVAWWKRWPRWGRHVMVCSLAVLGLGVCTWTALATFPEVKAQPTVT